MKPTIFVAIAAYADPSLPRTLGDAVSLAHAPDCLRFGICWQDDPAHLVELDAFRRDPRFRFIDRTTTESRGGPWARNLAQSLWRGEPYTLQIDSHMTFEPGWDRALIATLESMPAEKPLLTMNAPLFFVDDQDVLHRREDMGVPTTRVNGWRAPDWAPVVRFWPAEHSAPRSHPFRQRQFRVYAG